MTPKLISIKGVGDNLAYSAHVFHKEVERVGNFGATVIAKELWMLVETGYHDIMRLLNASETERQREADAPGSVQPDSCCCEVNSTDCGRMG